MLDLKDLLTGSVLLFFLTLLLGKNLAKHKLQTGPGPVSAEPALPGHCLEWDLRRSCVARKPVVVLTKGRWHVTDC